MARDGLIQLRPGGSLRYFSAIPGNSTSNGQTRQKPRMVFGVDVSPNANGTCSVLRPDTVKLSRYGGLTVVFMLVASAQNSVSAAEPPASRVGKLRELAVILPQETVSRDWDCQLWTPTLEQVACVEKAVLQQLKGAEKATSSDAARIRYVPGRGAPCGARPPRNRTCDSHRIRLDLRDH
jgi:hypothetical protein